MNKVLAIAWSIVRDALRRKVTWVVVVFGAIMAAIIPSLPSYGVGVVAGVYREVAIALTFVGALVVVLAFSVTRIPTETERRTVFNILGRDVSRWQYVSGIWVGVQIVMAGVLAAFLAITLAIGAYTYNTLSWDLAQASLAIWCEMGVISAFCLLFTARWGAVTGAVAALAFVYIESTVTSIWTTNPSRPAPAPWWVPSLDVFNVINAVAYGHGVSAAYIGSMLLAWAAWCALLLILATAVFQTRDL